VTVVKTAEVEATACDWHPSVKDGQTVANQLQAVVATIPGLWD